MTFVQKLVLVACTATTLLAHAAHAHEGHDDASPSPAPANSGGPPRIEASSDLFEIVGVIDNGKMTVFLDQYATNAPIKDATIDIEAGPAKGAAQPNPDGTYTFKHPVLLESGQRPVTFTISARGQSDLLTAELVIVDPHGVGAAAAPNWMLWASIAAALTLCIAAAVAIAWRSSRRQRGEGQIQ